MKIVKVCLGIVVVVVIFVSGYFAGGRKASTVGIVVQPDIASPVQTVKPITKTTAMQLQQPPAAYQPQAPSIDKFNQFIAASLPIMQQKQNEPIEGVTTPRKVIVTCLSTDIKKSDSVTYPFTGVAVLRSQIISESCITTQTYTITFIPVNGRWTCYGISCESESLLGSKKTYSPARQVETSLFAGYWAVGSVN